MSTISPDTLKSAGPFLVYIYYLAFPNDRTAVKAIVYGLYLVETVQLGMITYDAFQTFVIGFGRLDALNEVNMLWFDCCVIDGAVASVVQTFFAYRIFLLSKSKLLTSVIVLISLMQLGGAITAAVKDETVSVFSEVRGNFIAVSVRIVFLSRLGVSRNLRLLLQLSLGGSAACDVMIAISMTYVVCWLFRFRVLPKEHFRHPVLMVHCVIAIQV
ncbi:hypothetical protein E1B28_005155 [Marasmius oreades]|uniref:Uncharacterized protein n=1 Tax=Marasmius oreades TaxID=181124 RepID=A0A9P7V011_9AGAR|nr:uncharacterized protein E1B28_005155 [Marasmius oreades]KAG7097840.1 hypothetical protein E1B28_005155 [Marasmius oreades]